MPSISIMHSKKTPIRQWGEQGLWEVGDMREIISPIASSAAATFIPVGSRTGLPSSVIATVSWKMALSYLNIETSVVEI